MGATPVPTPIDFYFDFSSPYGFIASTLIDDVAEAAGRTVTWRPFLIGAVYKEHGGAPLDHPMKKGYAVTDMMRTARYHGIMDMRLPDGFPAHSVPPSRVFYWINRQDPDKARDFAKRVYRAFWIDGKNTSDPAAAVGVAAAMGYDAETVLAGTQDPSIKEELKDATDAAMARGVFGSPFVYVDGEAFWGGDRIDQIRKWLETGGF